MADLLSTGVSGLLASQIQLATVGNNISNASTPGYSRQTVQQTENVSQNASARFTIGSGVDVVGVQRAYSQFLTQAVWSTNTGLQGATTTNDLATTLNSVLSGSGDLQGSLDSFYGSLSDVANNPSDNATRQSLLGNAQQLATTFNTLGQQLDLQQSQVNTQIKNTVTSINTLSQQVADLNKQIEQSLNAKNAPNALLDQRDQLIQQLSGLTGISTVQENSGAIGVYTTSGQTLVAGVSAFKLSTGGNSYDSSRTDVFDASGNNITSSIGDGTLGALINYRHVLDDTQNQLGQSATALAASINQQQARGLDLNGNQGQPIFGLAQPQVQGNTDNAGNAQPVASVSDVNQLTASDYKLTYVGAGNGTNGWQLATTGGTAVSLTDNGDGTLSADGLTFDVSQGTAQTGDSFEVRPTRDAATSLSVVLSNPRGIAAASAVATNAGTSNTGGAQVTSTTVTDASNPNLLNAATVTFGAGSNYTITDAGGATISTGTYTPGQPIQANGWSLSLSGTPANGDTFNVGSNANGLNDNSNALSMASLSSGGVLDGGKTSVIDSFANLTARIGTIGSQAQANLSTQTSLNTQAVSAQQSASGVNLDEEAASLVKYQQSYQASAQVINAAQTLFNSLLNAVGG
ncbi:flagellar hook-associated protein FlgK [Oleiagrimonas sp. C23AA]|uniref:flagellar hook-associated protein FlgK n=1 Tax=Oleiagrimonas sp. C23AA TaxID=2719047 RepID=UPI0014218E09|nr:flagellar hook-associated protein FlgK [Oleiagrimonas sp. C23AA]NII09205.1 flagellar hook-associated protein FlgK [Oleiagrimonas sp. C23AA]